jgi:hypothetical protein
MFIKTPDTDRFGLFSDSRNVDRVAILTGALVVVLIVLLGVVVFS